MHPAKEGCSYKILKTRDKKIKLKFILQKACLEEKNNYFCTRFENESAGAEINSAQEKRRHVPRHIELTAALEEILKQRNRE